MAENIRLVIWDLDQTFWQGTLTEGGITYNEKNHDIVIELARRGIPSAICSKNDLATVQEVLQSRGVWDYFIFPSVNWAPKGPRIASLIEATQLRPETVLFIDDNPLNRQEAQHFVPGLRVADETFATDLLANPLLQGKPDADLSRLQQYKVLERRHQDQQSATGDMREFLLSSGITVTVDHDVETNLDRAIELINRTNQLNFTKSRLAEDIPTARRQLTELLAGYNIQAGLIRVQDNYGDYGYCGFYALRSFGSESRLEHFCFSCRILNMGIETWVFHTLRRPALKVVGQVLTDLNSAQPMPDWINQGEAAAATPGILTIPVSEVIARGGCNIASLTHYFQVANISVHSELNIARNGVDIRRDHTVFLRYAALGLSEADRYELTLMGFSPEDYLTALLGPQVPHAVWLLSFWADADFVLYRNKISGLRVPISLYFPGRPNDATQVRVEDLPPHLQTPQLIPIVERLATKYVYEGLISEQMFKENLHLVLSRAPHDTLIFILGNNETLSDDKGVRPMPWKATANLYTREVVAEYANVEWIDTASFSTEHPRGDPNHFNRLVYHRIFEHITALIEIKRRTR